MTLNPVIETLLLAEAETPNCALRLYLSGTDVLLKKWQLVRGGETGVQVLGVSGLRETLEDKRKIGEATCFHIHAISGVGVMEESVIEKIVRRFTGK